MQATSRELHALRDALPLADAPIESALQAALEFQAGPIELRRKPAHGGPICPALGGAYLLPLPWF